MRKGVELLEVLLKTSEKAANIARACRQNESLFKLLIQEKSDDEKNPRFFRDFKTLADVLIQETIRHEIGLEFPELAKMVKGEENNVFSNTLGKTVIVEVCPTIEETTKLLTEVLDNNEITAKLLADEVHRNISLSEVPTKIELDGCDVNIDIDDLGIWIDPIDSTADYISANTLIDEATGLHLSGLRCVSVLIGAYIRSTGLPVIGVTNQPFHNHDVSAVKSEEKEELLRRAAAQLKRLSSFRKTQEDLQTHLQEVPKSEQVLEDATITTSQNVLQLKQKGDEDTIIKPNQRFLINADAMKRIDELATTAYKLFNDPNYEAMAQERIKRSGSGDFVSGIAGKVINGVVGGSGSLSSGLSGGSSGGHHAYDSYGAPVPAYEEKPLSIWDFKKAIINTLIQALKALAGGAIAFKGHLIKGGGFLVQTTGRVISSAGEATSSLGTQLASSAIISAPKPAYDSSGYSYNPPHSQDYTYDGPPPSPDAGYTEQEYQQEHESPSEVVYSYAYYPTRKRYYRLRSYRKYIG